MAWIREFRDDEARGDLARQFEAAIARSGRVWNIVRVMGQNPRVLAAMMDLYRAVLFEPSPLSRVQREMIATVVSSEVGCFY